MKIDFYFQEKQKVFRSSVEKYPVTFYGGAKGGGKSYGLRNIMLLRRLTQPNSYGAIFRRTYPELEANHIRPLFQEHSYLKPYWNESKKLLTLPNGSTLQFCHCANESDVDLYQGREFHDLAIDEAGQWTETMFRKLQGSNRSSRPGIVARSILTGNPGGIGHSWLKRLFIERRFNDRERPNDYTFIQALVDDNPALLANDPDYVHRLNAEPNEMLRKAYRFGDWDVFAGQFFSELRREIHFIKPFRVPDHWRRFGSYDFGYNHPAAFGFFAVDEDGNVYLYRELVRAKLRIDEFAAELNRFEDTKKLEYIKAGHDCWAVKGVLKQGTPPTIAEEFANHGIYLQRAQIDRMQGAAQVRSYLAWQNKNGQDGKPRFYIFESCPQTFDTLSRMQHNPDKLEDVLKLDATETDPMSGDDAYDMVRYGLMSRPILTEALKLKLKPGTAEMVAHQQKIMDDYLEKTIERQQEEERMRDWEMTAGLDGQDVTSYYLNKRR
jgi:phage terminase large subunit